MLRQLSRALTQRLVQDQQGHKLLYEARESIQRLLYARYKTQDPPRFSLRYHNNILHLQGECRVYSNELEREREAITTAIRSLDPHCKGVIIS